MTLQELERIQRKSMEASNRYVRALQDPRKTEAELAYLKAQSDLAHREYENAWRLYQGQHTIAK